MHTTPVFVLVQADELTSMLAIRTDNISLCTTFTNYITTNLTATTYKSCAKECVKKSYCSGFTYSQHKLECVLLPAEPPLYVSCLDGEIRDDVYMDVVMYRLRPKLTVLSRGNMCLKNNFKRLFALFNLNSCYKF